MAPFEESYQKQKQFISDAGHELKTPVSVVQANLELLTRQIGENQWLSNIQYENERMSATSDTVIARGMGPGAGGEQPPEGTPPQQPGQAGKGESMAQSGETPPEMPEGQAPDGMGEGMPQEELTADSITVGASVTIEVDENNTAISVTLSGGMGAGPGGPGGGASEPESYSAVNEYTEDTSVSDETLTSEGTDENAVLVQTAGITASLDNVNIVRNSEDSTGGDSSSFYGVGAAALVTDGTLNISNSTIESDAAGGAGVFAYGSGTAYVSDTTITAKNGGMFYTTNTESTFVLSNVNIVNADDSEFLLKCTGNSNQRGWGTAGANGADSHFTAIEQTMEGDVIWDSISKLDFYLTQGSTWTGAMIQDESNAGAGGDGYGSVYIDADSTWIVTGDSTVSALSCAGTMKDSEGNTVSVVGTDGTVYVEGTSAYTVTVDSYSDSGDVSGASALDAWESFEVENLNA